MINQEIFDMLFRFANKNEYRKKIVILINIYSSHIFFLLYILGFIYILFNFNKFCYIDLLKYLFVPFIAIFISKIIRKNINTRRPFEILNIQSLVQHEGGNSMPSNHSVSAMVLAIAFIYIAPKYKIIFIVLAIITGMSRIMAGLHYPIDVIFGFLIGISIGVLGFFVLL